jgi:hypothetical protein
VALLVQTVVMRQNEAHDDFDEHAIRKTAYALWERRGAPIGSPDVDWIEAERQLREGRLDSNADTQQPGTTLTMSAHAGAPEHAAVIESLL